VTDCIQVPVAEIAWPTKNSRKFGERSERNVRDRARWVTVTRNAVAYSESGR